MADTTGAGAGSDGDPPHADAAHADAVETDLVDEERTLPGGAVGGAVRVGATVRRPAGPWTPTVHALLDHLNTAGLDAVPRALGTDERGREVLSYIEGESVGALGPREYPAWARSDELCVQVARWLARYHAVVASFRPADARWRSGVRSLAPDEIVCHNDVAPYNLIVRAGPDDQVELAGVVDWDVAGPGHRIDDLAYAAWTFVPLNDLGSRTDAEVARRLELIAGAYVDTIAHTAADTTAHTAADTAGGITAGTADVDAQRVLAAAPVRMRRAVSTIAAGAASGDPGMVNLAATGVIDRVERKVADLLARTPEITSALCDE